MEVDGVASGSSSNGGWQNMMCTQACEMHLLARKHHAAECGGWNKAGMASTEG
jgi:hypothetical protein